MFLGAAPILRARSQGWVRLFGSVTWCYSVFFSPQPQNLSAIQKKKSFVSNVSSPVHLYLVSSLCSVPGFPFYSPELSLTQNKTSDGWNSLCRTLQRNGAQLSSRPRFPSSFFFLPSSSFFPSLSHASGCTVSTIKCSHQLFHPQ